MRNIYEMNEDGNKHTPQIVSKLLKEFSFRQIDVSKDRYNIEILNLESNNRQKEEKQG